MKIKLQDDCHEIEIQGNAIRVVTPYREGVWHQFTTEEVGTLSIEVISRNAFIVKFNDGSCFNKYLGVIVDDSIIYTDKRLEEARKNRDALLASIFQKERDKYELSTNQKKAKCLVRFLRESVSQQEHHKESEGEG